MRIAAPGGQGVLVFPADGPLLAEARQTAREAVGKVAALLGADAPRLVRVRVVLGMPAVQLIDASRTAALLVVGSRGAGAFTQLVMGSVSGQVMHHARCPVVVVPPGPPGPAG